MRFVHAKKGSVLVSLLFVGMMIFLLALFSVKLGLFALANQRQQLLIDGVLLSVLGVRCDALKQLAEKSRSMESLVLSAHQSGITVQSGFGPEFERRVQEFRNALPGYKGRLSSAPRVVMQANELDRSLFFFSSAPSPLEMAVQLENTWVFNELGQKKAVNGVWARRLWSDRSVGSVQWGHHKSQAYLLDESLSAKGGYPQSWEDVVQQGRFKPYPTPYYRAVLSGDL